MPQNNIELSSLLETVDQAKSFLLALDEKQYNTVIAPHFSSSAGAHMRHIIDHYLALKDGVASNVVNYNKRHRHSNIETSPQAALEAWQEIGAWLTDMALENADMSLTIVCETSVNQTQNSHSQSTLARELVFVSSHAIHHFSLLAVMSSIFGSKTNSQFGVAPSTATYLRKQA
ncbi:hypothetical protein RS130_00925 [Paraglaciecola aquimarina]|uniref:DinB family protein n=1 Tax=Paraglaciecola aquimarina TaxID=1235557 RepID=A0ABU3SRN2_9ALTE|nr:hypothetical protein [Paraglaciecola aquimarina]MDU0352666.1 hypothetical protein [Paraglaciecola aquimarina]